MLGSQVVEIEDFLDPLVGNLEGPVLVAGEDRVQMVVPDGKKLDLLAHPWDRNSDQ